MTEGAPNSTNFDFRNSTPRILKCQTIQDIYPDIIDRVDVQTVFGLFYTLIWLVGVFGNLIVIYAAGCKHVAPSVRIVFILSLACSDLLICLTSLPITAVTIFRRDWIFPSAVCYVVGCFQGGGIFVSSFTLSAIAIDRYLLIVKAPGVNISFRQAVSATIVTWGIGYVSTTPLALFMTTRRYRGVCGTFCEEDWPDLQQGSTTSPMRRLYGLSVFVIQFLIPLLTSCFCYWSISNKLSKQVRTRTAMQSTTNPELEDRLISRNRRTNKMMIAMVASFILAWLPFNFCNVVRDMEGFDSWWLPVQHFQVFFASCHVIAMTSVICNPIIYSWFNEPFRNALIKLFLSWKSSHTRSADSFFERSHNGGYKACNQNAEGQRSQRPITGRIESSFSTFRTRLATVTVGRRSNSSLNSRDEKVAKEEDKKLEVAVQPAVQSDVQEADSNGADEVGKTRSISFQAEDTVL